MPFRYLASLKRPLVILWCYLIWYVVTVINHFDPTPRIWLNALGISLLIGIALMLSVGLDTLRKSSRWVSFRLFMMPFGVSSISTLIKGQGFFLVVPPSPLEQAESFGACAVFLLLVAIVKRLARRSAA